MKAKLSIACREEGLGRPSIERFNNLADASKYIQDRWQGAEYMDGSDGFHTDYCEYTLRGFTLKDIGVIGWDDDGQCRTLAFHLYATLRGEKSDKPRIIATRGGPDNETHHYRASEALVAAYQANGKLLGVWTDAEYAERFGSPYVPESADDSPALTMTETHASHEKPDDHVWCPLCQRIISARPAEQVPF